MKKKVWFSSDFHLGHGNIIKYCKRPFLCEKDQRLLDEKVVRWEDRHWRVDKESIEMMDNSIINNTNAVIHEDDDFWFLGDFCFAPKQTYYKTVENYRRRINCKNMFIIYGNHDNKSLRNLFSGAFKSIEIEVEGQKIELCHYRKDVITPGFYHLYGHAHGTFPDDPYSLSFDCGVDCHNFKPLSFEDVVLIMSKKYDF